MGRSSITSFCLCSREEQYETCLILRIVNFSFLYINEMKLENVFVSCIKCIGERAYS